jgi:putative peptidoglycan lipid II flippase
VLLVAPAAVGMLLFSGPMVSAIFGFKRLTLTDVQMASWALMAYSWGLMTFSLIKVLAPGYFARQDTRTPVRAGMIALAVNMALNIGVALPASRMGFPAPHILLATSTCASSAVNAFLLWRGLRKRGIYNPSRVWRSFLPRILIACIVMGALLWWMSGDLAHWLAMPQWQRVWRCLAGIAAAALLYFAVLFALGVRYKDLRTAAAT